MVSSPTPAVADGRLDPGRRRLPTIVAELKRRGYGFATIDDSI
jgi:hypothetical protein